MRPYRAKRKDNNQWVYGWYAYEPVYGHVMLIEEKEVSCLREIEVDPDTIGQSTGKKDKYSKDIYAGDEIRMTFSDDDKIEDDIIFEGIVLWENETACFGVDTKGDGIVEIGLVGNADELEIIDTKHDEVKE